MAESNPEISEKPPPIIIIYSRVLLQKSYCNQKEIIMLNENENQCKSMLDCPLWESLFSEVNDSTFVDQHL